jgi:hypothetical protein
VTEEEKFAVEVKGRKDEVKPVATGRREATSLTIDAEEAIASEQARGGGRVEEQWERGERGVNCRGGGDGTEGGRWVSEVVCRGRLTSLLSAAL